MNRSYVKKGDTLARYANWHRRYEVLATKAKGKDWLCTIVFKGNVYADGTTEPPAQNRKPKARDILVPGIGDTSYCPIPAGYGLVEGTDGTAKKA